MYLKQLVTITFFGLMLFFTTKSLGQVALRLELNQKRYLKYESIFAKVTFRNYSDRAIAFSDSPDHKGKLKFEILKLNEGVLTQRRNTKIPIEGLLLKPGQTTSISYNLSKYYPIYSIGQYRVKAIMSYAAWPASYQSNSTNFSIGNGINVFKRIFGVEDPNNKNKDISRTYLIQSAYNGKFKVFYLIVEDNKMIYQVTPIGYDIGAGINCELDGLNRLHILMQLDPRIWHYFIYNTKGKKILKEVYHKTKYSPKFYRNPKNGKVTIIGGEKEIEGVYYGTNDGTLFGKGGSNIAPATKPTNREAPKLDQ